MSLARTRFSQPSPINGASAPCGIKRGALFVVEARMVQLFEKPAERREWNVHGRI
jgi:hypothetical protein